MKRKTFEILEDIAADYLHLAQDADGKVETVVETRSVMTHSKKHKKHHDSPGGNESSEPAGHQIASANSERHYSNHESQDRPSKMVSDPDWWMVWLTGFLGVATFATFWVLLVQLWHADENFLKDERPYLWPSEMAPVDSQYNAGEKIRIKVSFGDYGKSPAMRETSLGEILIGPDALEKADTWFANLSDKPPSDKPLNEAFIPPGVPDGHSPAFNIVETKINLTPDDAKFIFSTRDGKDTGYVLVMRLYYADINGNAYHSDVCSQSTTTRQLGACRKHNEVK